MSGSNSKPTLLPRDLPEAVSGNNVFRGAAVALGLQGETARVLLQRVLKGAGYSPEHVSAEEFGLVLPEIEVLVRKLLPPEMAQERMQRLQKFLFQIDT
jgi:hypothetical protein